MSLIFKFENQLISSSILDKIAEPNDKIMNIFSIIFNIIEKYYCKNNNFIITKIYYNEKFKILNKQNYLHFYNHKVISLDNLQMIIIKNILISMIDYSNLSQNLIDLIDEFAQKIKIFF